VNKSVEEKEIKTGKNAGKTRKYKTLSGKGKLTGKVIDKLTVYYGLSIRRNCTGPDAVQKMKTAIWATFFHYSSTDKKPQHEKCPSGADSWCDYQKALATTGIKHFRHNYEPLPADVLLAIKPVYEDPSKDALLKRCVGGFTQNNNESLNQLIWKIAPNNSYGGANIVEIATNVAVCTFNDGNSALMAFLEEIGVALGPSCHEYVKLSDNQRIYNYGPSSCSGV